MNDITEGDGDLSSRIGVMGRDELSQLAQKFNTFVDTIHQIILRVKHVGGELDQSVGHLGDSVTEANESVSQQKSATNTITDLMERLQESNVSVAERVTEANDLMIVTHKEADRSRKCITNCKFFK